MAHTGATEDAGMRPGSRQGGAVPRARRPLNEDRGRRRRRDGLGLAGLLADAGNEVWAIDTWQEHVDAIRENGLRVEGASGDRTVRLQATSDPAEVGPVDFAVIATKARDVEAAAERARPLLGPDTVVVPIQNGLGSADKVAASSVRIG